ncbi:hypothetical protein BJX68DRAFT_266770 [Aspergillus pseudodeflectus]|uniref:Uncharacterized protein n=2 Tax=Aspergillus subgen. Nidulantes TaxID=2720870 RepID=A0A0U5GVZ8_ASPCI|nr:hypothetical protein ASPCAL08049 [Aspergillus calidoustus]
MSSNGQDGSQMTNGTDNNLSEGNLNNVPDESGVDRYSQSSSSDSPYYAHAGMGDRSDHMNQLSSQLDASDELLKN